jgi:hypothetical protein
VEPEPVFVLDELELADPEVEDAEVVTGYTYF